MFLKTGLKRHLQCCILQHPRDCHVAKYCHLLTSNTSVNQRNFFFNHLPKTFDVLTQYRKTETMFLQESRQRNKSAQPLWKKSNLAQSEVSEMPTRSSGFRCHCFEVSFFEEWSNKGTCFKISKNEETVVLTVSFLTWGLEGANNIDLMILFK